MNLPPRRLAGDRGAGVVEYGLLLGIFMIAVVGTLKWVQGQGTSALDRQSGNLDYAVNDGGSPTTASTSTSTSTSTTTTSSTSTTTSTAPPASSTTTTTAAPTTTSTTTPTGSGMTALTATAKPTVDWWNGKDGAWLDNVTFNYGWKNGATITVQVTRNYGNNKTATSTESVYIGSGSSTPYLSANAFSNSQASDVVSVDLVVISIKTQDDKWQEQTFLVASPKLHIDAPKK